MTGLPTLHLTVDELDAFHSGALSREARFHLETCSACQALATSDRDLVSHLERVSVLGPTAGFADRVMSRVTVAEPVVVPVLSFPTLTRRQVFALAALAAGIVISVAWSATNRPFLDALLSGTGAGLADAGWAAFRGIAAVVSEQPWFETVRRTATAPFPIALISFTTVAIFASGLVVLRRLVSPSAATVSSAGV
jgi:hypothetical protein